MSDEEDFSELSRAAAKRNLDARSKMMVHRIKAMPPAERFRLVADFIDKGLGAFALQTAEYALAELRKESERAANGGKP